MSASTHKDDQNEFDLTPGMERAIEKTLALAEGVVIKRHTSSMSKMAAEFLGEHRVVTFLGRLMILSYIPYPHFIPLYKDYFLKLAYPRFGGLRRSMMSDLYSYIENMAPDLSGNSHLISFGYIGNDFDPAHPTHPVVWDSRELTHTIDGPVDQTVWRSPYTMAFGEGPVEFIMQLAGNDQGIYDDIMQSMAPIIMEKKPDGVVWWVGAGANGKSTLMDALYRIFPGQFSSINVKRLVDGRDTPSLNGTLANIVKESSEGRVEDSETYKNLGTHENFRVHKFHSQDDIEVNGNIHSIFSANNIPSFNDKGHSIRRRTYIIPFNQTFDSDPDFERRTFTPEFFGRLITEMTKYALRLRAQGYRYKWSATTLAAKLEYDAESGNAEEYVKELIDDGAVAFTDYTPVKYDYERWCMESGYVPLGIGNLRKAMKTCGFERVSRQMDNGSIGKIYRLSSIDSAVALEPMGGMRAGIMTLAGFAPEEELSEPVITTTVQSKQTTILDGKW